MKKLQDLHARARVVAGQLETVLMRLVEDGSVGVRAEASRASLVRSIAGLSSFVEISSASPRLLASLDEARAALAAARHEGASPTDSLESEGLAEASRWLDALRTDALDWVATHPVVPIGMGQSSVDANDSNDARLARGAFVASVGRPSRHACLPIPPLEVIPPDPERPVAPWVMPSLDDPDEEERGRGDVTVHTLGTDVSEPTSRGQRTRLARDCAEDIGALGRLRVPFDEEPWGDAQPFEARLLANLDALVAQDLPPFADDPIVVRQLYRYAVELAVPDSGRAFALAFPLACVPSDLASRWIAVAFRRSHPATFKAYTDALALGSASEVDRALEALLREDERPELLVAALSAVRRRRVVDMGVLAPLIAHPSSDVRTAAVSCLVHADRETSVPILVDLLDDEDGPLSCAAAEALTLLGDPRGPTRLRALSETLDLGTADARAVGARAVRMLSLVGDPRDADRLWALAPRVGALEWIGWLGHPAHREPLVEALRHFEKRLPESEMEVRATNRALERMLGPSSDRSILVGEHAWPSAESWAERKGGAAKRLRLGVPHSHRAAALELARPTTAQGLRRHLADELSIALAMPLPIDVDGWVASQREMLGTIVERFA